MVSKAEDLPPYCQSCAMPMRQNTDFGTEKTGDKSKEYCKFCFQNGKFTDDGITLEQKIEKLVRMAVAMGQTEANARAMASNILPTLKRWKK